MKNGTGPTRERNYDSISNWVTVKLFLFVGHPRDAWEENDRPNQW